MSGLLFYNMGAGILRAVGDSRRPFYYLVTSAVINIVLDLVFVIQFHMGVKGVAYATIIAQAVSALLTLITLMRTSSCVRVTLTRVRLHARMLLQIIQVGIPAALQLSVTAFSNVFVQSYINQFGADAMGGWTAYTKIDQVLILPIQSLSLACTTFVGQNLGGKLPERAHRGVQTSLWMSSAVTVFISVLIVATAPHLVVFFNGKPEVVEYGTLFLRHMIPMFVICCPNQVYAAALRGAGNSKVPMYVMLCSFVLFRQCYLFVMSNYISNTILPLAMGYPAGWAVCSLVLTLYYHRFRLSGTKLNLEESA